MTFTSTGSTLTAEQQQQAEEDGYVIVEGLLAPEECRAYIERLDDYAHERRVLPPGLAIQRETRVARGELAAQSGDDDCDGTRSAALSRKTASGMFLHDLHLHGMTDTRSRRSRRAINVGYMAAEFRYPGERRKPEYLRVSGVAVPGDV